MGVDSDGDGEALASAGAAHETQVAELGHLVLHHGRVVTELAAVVVVIPSAKFKRERERERESERYLKTSHFDLLSVVS